MKTFFIYVIVVVGHTTRVIARSVAARQSGAFRLFRNIRLIKVTRVVVMIDINKLKFGENGLIPAIITDVKTGKVLMLAYMNAESLQISIKEGKTCFWSRSRGKLWRKGETSGNIQHITDIKTDCDMDTLLITVDKEGPACHTGADSCFIEDLYSREVVQDIASIDNFSLKTLHDIILDRKENVKPGSYTNYLFAKGIDKILKKIGEESAEVIIAAKAGDKPETIYELADLVFHALVLMTELEIKPEDIIKELASRHVPKRKET